MTLNDARNAIRASIARGTSTPTLGGATREEYIETEAKRLDHALIEPVPVQVVEESHSHGLKERTMSEVPLAIAHVETQWLCVLPTTGEFFLAFGEAPNDLSALGFFSDDALAEWLG